jgi:hypothetical protein
VGLKDEHENENEIEEKYGLAKVVGSLSVTFNLSNPLEP